jgi:hypothetical protein
MKYTSGGISVKAGPQVTLEVTPKPPPPPKTQEKLQAGAPPPTPKAEIAQKRLRVSAWQDHPGDCYGHFTNRATGEFAKDTSHLEAAKGALDDITFLGCMVRPQAGGVKWKTPSVGTMLPTALDYCHQNGIQFFAGFSMADEGSGMLPANKAFVDWIANPVSPTAEQYAQQIADFVFVKSGFDGVDGIAFDLELNGLRPEHADNFGKFYGALADILLPLGKVLSVATGIGDVNDESKTTGIFRAQPFRLAKGHPNFIIRPMAYDMFNLSDAQFDQWHKDVVDYALNKVGLDPGQFQLGLKISKNVHAQNWIPDKGWSERKCTFDTPGIVDRCQHLLRPNGVGLVTFAGWGDSQAFNSALNAGLPPAGTEGTPLQAPRGMKGEPAPQAQQQQAQAAAEPQQPAPQAATSGRTRMSIFCFGTPFIKGFGGSGVELDEGVLDKVVESRVDDVSLVNTLAPPESNWAQGGVVKDTAVAFSSGFRPASQGKYSADYLDKLIAACHARKVQVIIGYCIGNDPSNKSGDSYCKGFTDWLAAMSADQVKAHAQAVVDFIDKVQADGITFDLEIVSLGQAQKDNLWLLYKTLAEKMPGKMVAYATGPFTEEGKVDGVDCMAGIQIQSYLLAKQAPNLVARPMCYDEHAFALPIIGRSIDYALGAAGLTAAQIQMGIYCTDPYAQEPHGGPQVPCSAMKGKPRSPAGTEATLAFTKDVMAPKRVSMVYYQVPGGNWTGSKMDLSGAITALAHVKDFEALMNPGEKAPGESGAPLQVPRG